MENTGVLEGLLDYLSSSNFLASVVVFAIASALLYIIKQYLIKKVAYTGKQDQHKNTFIGMLFNVLQYIVIVIAVVIILQLNGVNVGSILAGFGIAATIIGLALQDTLKDIFSGINIYNNNFYKVGDMVRYNGEECDVKYFSARVTKFQSLMSNSTYTVNNSLINSIEKIKDNKACVFRFRFNTDYDLINKALAQVVEDMKDNTDYLKSISSLGLIDIDDNSVRYAIAYSAPAHKYLPIRMEIFQRAYKEFKKLGISPVFNEDFRD